MSGTVTLAERIAQYEQRIAELESETDMLRFACNKREKRIAELEQREAEALALVMAHEGRIAELARLLDLAETLRVKAFEERDKARSWGSWFFKARGDVDDIPPPWERSDG